MLSGWPGFQGWTLLLLVVWLYHSVLYRLVVNWTDPDFGYCFAVPAFSLFILWQEREKLKSIESPPSWAGMPLILLAMLMLTLGEMGAERFTSQISFVVLLAGLVVQFRGWPFFRSTLFPWAFLILMVPLPNLILQKLTLPLQTLAAKLATLLLQTVGVPALREGNAIYLPHFSLDVVQACSGMRSLLTVLTLAIIYGYLMEKRIWVRVALACSALPIAVAANGFRIFVAGILGEYWSPDKAKGRFHEMEGVLVFVVALILFFTLHRMIELLWKGAPESRLEHSPRITTSRPNAQKRSRASTPVSNWSIRFLIPALLMLTTATGLALSHHEIVPKPPPIGSFPKQLDGWSGTDQEIDQETLDILGHGDFLDRGYEHAGGAEPWIDLFIAYYPTQKMGDTPHSPEHCLPGAGWVPTLRQVVPLSAPDGTSFPVNRYVVSNAGNRMLVLYWYQAHGRMVTSEYRLKYYLISDSIRMHRSDGALIRLTSPMNPGESPDAAQARIMQLGNHFLPLLDTYIPR